MPMSPSLDPALMRGSILTPYRNFARQVPRIAIAGDSRGANHLGGGGNFSVRGPLCWAKFKLNGRFEMDPAWISAVAGTQIAIDNSSGISLLSQLNANIDAWINLGVGFIYMISDVNDFGAATARTGEQAIADMTTCLNLVLGRGLTPIVMTCVNTTVFNATKTAYVDRYNAWVRGLRLDPRIVVVDAAARVLDWTSATSQPIGGANTTSSYLTDGTHFGPLVAELIGNDLAVALDPRLPPGVLHGLLSPADAYDATNNVMGSLLGSTGRLVGTSGALTDKAGNAGSASTGTVATGARLYKTSGQTVNVVGAVQTDTFQFGPETLTLPVQDIKITANSGTGNQLVTLLLPDITTGFAAGDIVQASALVNVKSGVGLFGVSLQMFDNPTSGASNQSFSDLAPLNGYFQQARSRIGIQRTGRMVLSSLTGKIGSQIAIACDAATANIDVEIASIAIRKVAA